MPHKTNAVYNGQEKTICLIYTNRPHKGRLVSINEGYIIDWNCIVIVWLLCGYCVVIVWCVQGGEKLGEEPCRLLSRLHAN